MTTARDLAAQVLTRVEKDRAFASAALDAELARAAQLTPRDRALATELVYGTLRVLPWLESEIAHFAPRGTRKLDPHVRALLCVATYQLMFTRVPPFAAVSEAVRSVRALRGERLAAFSNAVLRKLSERAATLDDVGREEAVVASAPAWLREALESALTAQGALAFLRCGAEPPPVALRVREASERDGWIARLRAEVPSARFEPGGTSPLAILVRGAGKPQQLAGHAEGAWVVQEEGAQVAALAVGARPGDVVLDACAGRGQKTSVFAQAVGPGGGVDACDAIPSKLERLRLELAHSGLAPRATFAIDWTRGSGEVRGLYDRVVVDAPCSGVGTLRRRPEIGLRRDRTDLAALTSTQIAIASRAAEHVRPGGSLVYIVCSVLREEAEDVVSALLAQHADLVLAPWDEADSPAAALWSSLAENAATFRLLPTVHGTDGYFVARFAKRGSSRAP